MAPAPCGTGTWRPFILCACRHAPHATHPDGRQETAPRVAPRAIPIRFCSRWGLPCRSCCQSRGGLLPHPFTLTPPIFRLAYRWQSSAEPEDRRGGLLSVALSLGSPPPDVIRHRVSMEPGLSSPAAFRQLQVRPPGQLAPRIKGLARENANEKPDERQKIHASLGTLQPGPAGLSFRRVAASPSSNRPRKPDSCALRHGRHCISGSSCRSRRRRVHAPSPDISCRI